MGDDSVSRIEKLLSDAKRATTDFHKENNSALSDCEDQLSHVIATLANITEAHSGSWAGYQSSLYYLDFQRPPINLRFNVEWGGINGIPEGWQERTYEDIVNFIKRKHRKVDLSAMVRELNHILERARKTKSRVVADLSFIRGLGGWETESEMLHNIEKMELTVSARKFVESARPKSMITRDTTAVSQGIIAPPHIQFWSAVMQSMATITSIRRFLDQSNDLIEQVKVRSILGPQASKVFDSQVGRLAGRTEKIHRPMSNQVFVVHGHDESLKNQLEIFLGEVGLEAVVLHRKPDEGQTVIEKLEKYGDVSYAFVLLTPDDIAYSNEEESKKEGDRKKETRARQNVIFEMGYFVGLLGRDRICCLYKPGVTLPTDIHGVLYKKIETDIQTVAFDLIKELKAAGFTLK